MMIWRLFLPELFSLSFFLRRLCPRLFSLCFWLSSLFLQRLFSALFFPPVSCPLFLQLVFWLLWPLFSRLFWPSLCSARQPSLFLTAVRAEGPGRRELAELVPDHRLRDEDGDVFFAVVDGDRVPDHLREDRRGPRPGFHHLFFPGLVHRRDPPHQALLDPRALFRRSSYGLPPFFLPR